MELVRDRWRVVLEIAVILAFAFAVILGARSFWEYRSRSSAEALYAAAEATLDPDARLQGLREIADRSSRTAAGKQAMMMVANLLADREEYDQAAEVLKKLAGRSRSQPLLKIASMHRLAEIELAKGEAPAAAETYLRAAADPANIIGWASRLRAAGAFAKAGDVERAEQLCRQVIQEAGDQDPEVRRQAEEQLLWLIAQRSTQG